MKKALILLLIFGFVSCANNDDNENQELNDALIGEWSLTNVSCFCGFPDLPNFDLTTVTFSDTVSELTVLNSGNEVYFRENGTYSYTSTDTRIIMENEQAFDVELNDNRLLLIFVDNPAIADDEVTYSFVRN